MQGTARGLAERGVTVVTFDFPYRLAGRRLPDRGPILEAAYREAWSTVAASHPGVPLFIGGKSMGGRIATQVCAVRGLTHSAAGAVCFGYPLHPPGRPAQRRDAHLPAVPCPMLLVHGTRDPFGSPDEMKELERWLPQATLLIVEGGDHSLAVPARQDRSQQSFARVLDAVADWIRNPIRRAGSKPL